MNNLEYYSVNSGGIEATGRTPQEAAANWRAKKAGKPVKDFRPVPSGGASLETLAPMAATATARPPLRRQAADAISAGPVTIRARRALHFLPFEIDGELFQIGRKASYNSFIDIPLLNDRGQNVGTARLLEREGNGIPMQAEVADAAVVAQLRRQELGLRVKIETYHEHLSAGRVIDSLFVESVTLTRGTPDAGTTKPEVID